MVKSADLPSLAHLLLAFRRLLLKLTNYCYIARVGLVLERMIEAFIGRVRVFALEP